MPARSTTVFLGPHTRSGSGVRLVSSPTVPETAVAKVWPPMVSGGPCPQPSANGVAAVGSPVFRPASAGILSPARPTGSCWARPTSGLYAVTCMTLGKLMSSWSVRSGGNVSTPLCGTGRSRVPLGVLIRTWVGWAAMPTL